MMPPVILTVAALEPLSGAVPSPILNQRPTFTVPPGWHVETRGSGDSQHVVMSKAAAGTYCMAVVYASTEASNSLDASFASEWARVALKTLDAVATPRPAITQVGSLRVAAGAAASTAQGQPIIGLLLVRAVA